MKITEICKKNTACRQGELSKHRELIQGTPVTKLASWRFHHLHLASLWEMFILKWSEVLVAGGSWFWCVKTHIILNKHQGQMLWCLHSGAIQRTKLRAVGLPEPPPTQIQLALNTTSGSKKLARLEIQLTAVFVWGDGTMYFLFFFCFLLSGAIFFRINPTYNKSGEIQLTINGLEFAVKYYTT